MANGNNQPQSAYAQVLQNIGLPVNDANITALQNQYPPGQQANSQGGGYGMSAGYSLTQNPMITQALNPLNTSQFNLGSGQQGQAPGSIQGQVSQDPMNAAVNLGAAALDMPAIYNPTPGQIPAGSKGGVSTVQSPVSSGTVPSVAPGPWNTNAGVFANQQQAQGMQAWQQAGASGSLADAASIEKARGYPTGSIGQTFYNDATAQGTAPASNNPAPTAGGTPTPVMPANAATPTGRPASPYATAPAAPGIQAPAIPPAVHNDALANAGKALYAHFGGDPNTASPTDIANFHTQLTGMMGGLQNFTAGASTSPPAAPTRMATGGLVPGQGNRDTVPALLTPGEYVIPKSQVAQVFGGRAPVKMQSGGFVTEDDGSDDPTEARHRALMAVSKAAQATQQTGAGAGQQPSSVPSQAPAAPGGYTGPSAQQLAAQYGGTSATPAGGFPSQTPSVAPSYDVPSDPDPDWQYTGQESTAGATGAGVGGASAAAGASGVVGGLFSGLQSAINTYKNSIGSWQMQKPDFGTPSGGGQGQPAAQFTQEQVDQKKKEQQNPMMTAQYGYNPYLQG
jgi:hypothetical protein